MEQRPTSSNRRGHEIIPIRFSCQSHCELFCIGDAFTRWVSAPSSTLYSKLYLRKKRKNSCWNRQRKENLFHVLAILFYYFFLLFHLCSLFWTLSVPFYITILPVYNDTNLQFFLTFSSLRYKYIQTSELFVYLYTCIACRN